MSSSHGFAARRSGARGALAAILAVAFSMALMGVARADAVTTEQFQGSYRAYDPWVQWKSWQTEKCTENRIVYGSEPVAAGKYPVVVYLHGMFADWLGAGDAQRFVQLAAAQGFVAVAPTYDSWLTESQSGIDRQARCIFSAAEPGNGLSRWCALPKANCGRGVLVAGMSEGGSIVGRAANYSPSIRAAWVMGVSGPAVLQSIAIPLGTRQLPNARARITVGQMDVQITDPVSGMVTGFDMSGLQAMTGLTCVAFNCLQPDGSGYYVVQNSEVADGVADHCYWLGVDLQHPAACSWSNNFDPGFTPPSTTPWSLITNLNWLRGQLS